MQPIYSAPCARCHQRIAADFPLDPPLLCDRCLAALDLDDGMDEELGEWDLADLATSCDAQILRQPPTLRKRGA
jgi:hypothetical protein